MGDPLRGEHLHVHLSVHDLEPGLAGVLAPDEEGLPAHGHGVGWPLHGQWYRQLRVAPTTSGSPASLATESVLESTVVW